MTIDMQALDKLRELVGGGEDDLRELIDSFLDEAPGLMDVVVTAQQSGDLNALRRAAHSLKSNARDMGALDLAETSARLEAKCGAGDLPTAAEVEAARLLFLAAATELRGAYPVHTP